MNAIHHCWYYLRCNALSQNILQLDGIGGKSADSFRQFVCCHLILIQHPAERLLIHRYFLHTGHFLCYTAAAADLNLINCYCSSENKC